MREGGRDQAKERQLLKGGPRGKEGKVFLGQGRAAHRGRKGGSGGPGVGGEALGGRRSGLAATWSEPTSICRTSQHAT